MLGCYLGDQGLNRGTSLGDLGPNILSQPNAPFGVAVWEKNEDVICFESLLGTKDYISKGLLAVRWRVIRDGYLPCHLGHECVHFQVKTS